MNVEKKQRLILDFQENKIGAFGLEWDIVSTKLVVSRTTDQKNKHANRPRVSPTPSGQTTEN